MNAKSMRRINSIWRQCSGKDSGNMGRKLRGKGGFTLVELIVVLVVLGILCTLAVMSIIGWQDYADFKQNNEAARSIFSAAQIQLTQYAERGQLSALKNAVVAKGTDPENYLLSDDMMTDGQLVWQSGNTGSIYYLKVKKGNYSDYLILKGQDQKNMSPEERRICAFYDLIDPYIADKEMLDAAICIEFDPDPKTAQVFSVFYNANAIEFTYEGSGSGSDKAQIYDRSTDSRRKDKTGYYGVEVMSRGTDPSINKPVITNLRLNNEDTLNLTWSTKNARAGDDRDLISLVYSISIYKASDKNNPGADSLLEIEALGSTDKTIPEVQGADGCITGVVNGETYRFPIAYDRSKHTLTLVLDGLDLFADELDSTNLKETASIRRFSGMVDAGEVYAVISGTKPSYYNTTATKNSNEEHALFADEKSLDSDTVIYGIENARHLNNIRFKEKDMVSASTTIEYQVKNDISWEYALNSGFVYKKAEAQWPPEGDVRGYYFRPLSSLRKNSTLMSESEGRIRSLIRFRMDINQMGLEEGENSALGLVAENYGVIKNLTLEDVYVNGVGKDDAGEIDWDKSAVATGGFAGKNMGRLSGLSVKGKQVASGSEKNDYNNISGYLYVGGIAGMTEISLETVREARYESLVNRAEITGQQYVGGISGGVVNDGSGMIRIGHCENYGKVRGLQINPNKGIYFFGGIVGYTELSEAVRGSITISDCQSSPYYTDEEAEELLDELKTGGTARLVETFAGGIVGFNDGAIIENCNTARESVDKQGYMVGKDYVGGIVGYNSGRAGALRAQNGNNRNQLHVIGHSYVGGIIGCNAVGTLDNSKEPYTVHLTEKGPATETAAALDWINEGIITATGDYVGGITGYNGETGLIINSYSSVDYGDSAEKLSGVSSNARFAGGVAGYNKGIITNRDARYGDSGTDSTVSVVSVISGRDYVGGVVGCNDVGGEIISYALNGGYITGSHFVGGFVGLNMEAKIFESSIQSDPNRVTGDYFVGGILGANVLPVGDSAMLEARFGTDNFLGSVKAENGAFAGGFIGYNSLLKESTAASILSTAEKLCGLEPFAADAKNEEPIENPELLVAEIWKEQEPNTTASMVITGEEANPATELLSSITARIYVGGVVGYNNPDTILTIKNTENITQVEATGFVSQKEGNISGLRDYSYAGGIIGKVEQNVTLDNCRNKDVGSVIAKGTYTGGLAEINYGTIQNCYAGNIGDGTASYIGGLVGVNASKTLADGTIKHGKITNCYINGQINGQSYVGGLAAENYGEIAYNSVRAGHEATVNAGGTYVGGITGYAHKGGIIRLSSDVELDINVNGSAAYVGGIAGVNAGRIEMEGTDTTVSNTEKNVIIGRENVGGFIGVQIGPEESDSDVTIKGFTNYAHVQASYGYAGGIVAIVTIPDSSRGEGENQKQATKKIKIQDCENYGTVELLIGGENEDGGQDLEDDLGASDENDGYNSDIENEDDRVSTAVGGITALNRGIIERCGNYGKVQAGSGYLGGVSAINYCEIRNSETANAAYEDRDDSSGLTLTGDLYVGGIAALNKKDAVIEACAVRKLILRNQEESSPGFMGGIAAQNEGEIKACQAGVPFNARVSGHVDSDYELSSYASEYVKKGITAETLLDGDEDTVGFSVVLVSNATDVVMGGIVGANQDAGKVTGKIKQIDDSYSIVAADLRFDGSGLNYFGNIGGIAGINNSEISGYEFNGYIKGEANDPARSPSFSANYDLEPSKNRVYGYGGIVGRNGSDEYSLAAVVEKCRLGMAKIEGTGDASNRANVGGVAGYNGIKSEINRISFAEAGIPAVKKEQGQKEWFSYTHKSVPASSHTNGKNYEGSVWVEATTYGHVGGVVGFNHGKVSGINWDKNYEDARNKDKDNSSGGYFEGGAYVLDAKSKTEPQTILAGVDNTSVLVTAEAGHVGGIVGYNRRNGSINQAVTGRYWLVYAETQQQDNGTGGIAGYNISEQDLTKCDNHATVAKLSDGDSVGGMVGRNENNTTSSWRFYDCHNYGNIAAKARSGGFIGNIKNKGGTLEDCINFGSVMANGSRALTGGIVGYVYGGLSGEVLNLVKCENHGEVNGTSSDAEAGGIVGATRAGYSMGIRFDGCVNTGMIGGITTGGILGTSKYKVTMTYCRNYGYGSKNNGGFYGLTSAGVSAKDCFGVTGAEVEHPTGKADNNAGSYYFVETMETEEPAFWVERIAANGKAAEAKANRENLGRIINGKEPEASANFYFQETSENNSIVLEFNTVVSLDSITLRWPDATDKDKRKTTYTVRFMNGKDTVASVIQEEPVVGEIVYDKDDIGDIEATSVIIDNIKAMNGTKKGNAILFKFSAEGTPGGYGQSVTMTPIKENTAKVSWTNDMVTVYTPDAPISVVTKDDNGMPLLITKDGDTHYVININNQKVIEDVASYTTADIYNTAREYDSALSYLLCKGNSGNGTDGKKNGLDALLLLSGEKEELTKPVDLEYKTDSGEYKVSWTGSDNAQYYIVTCVYETANGPVEVQYASFVTSYIISTAVENGGKEATGVSVTVKACRGDRSSEPSDNLDIVFGKRLPYPQIRWKLSGQDGYWVELQNRQEYADFVKNYLSESSDAGNEYVEKELENINIKSSGFKLVDFPVKDGGEKENGVWKKYQSDKKDNIYFNSYADYTGNRQDIIRSVTTSLESRIPGWDVYTGEMMAKVRLGKTTDTSGVGFSGKTVRELTYHVKMDAAGNSWVPEMRTEMIAVDPDLKVPVAVAVSEQTRLSTSGSSYNRVALSGLPMDFLDREQDGVTYKYKDVQVRTYPTKMTNDVVYQGWNVGDETYSLDELYKLSVTEDGAVITNMENQSDSNPLISNGKVPPGYVIVWNGADSEGHSTYKLYYNALLKALEQDEAYDPSGKELKKMESWKYTEGGNSAYKRYQVFFHFINLEEELKQTMPAPVIYADAAYDDEHGWHDGVYDETDTFCLTWDQAEKDGKPAYTKDNGYEEKDYEKATYRLTITGVKDGKSTTLVNNITIETQRRTGDNYNTYQADASTWDYDKVMVTLTRVGTEQGTEEDSLTAIFPATVSRSFAMRKRLPQVKDVKIELAKDESGVIIQDNLSYVLSFTGVITEDERDVLDYYRIEVKSRDMGNPSETLVLGEAEKITDTSGIALSLDAFRGGEEISVSVQAIAKEGDTTYRSGFVSPAAEMTVPSRLAKPEMGIPAGGDEKNLTAGENDILRVSEFEEGSITLFMKKEANTPATLRYQIALELYDSAEDAETSENTLIPLDKSGNVLLLPSKDNPADMIYVSAEANYYYTLKDLSADFAGKYLKVVMRSTSNSYISSIWTDVENPGNKEDTVTEYMLFQLPKVQIDTVEFQENTDMIETERPIMTPEGTAQGERVTVSQVQAEFTLAEHADSYRITLIQEPKPADRNIATSSNAAEYIVSHVHEMTLNKMDQEGRYELEYWSTKTDGSGNQSRETIKLAVDQGEKALPYTEILLLTESGYYITLESSVRLEAQPDGAVHVIFKLPDCMEVTDNSQYLGVQKMTEQILVQSIADNANINYSDSKWALLYWLDDNLNGIAELEAPKASYIPELEGVRLASGITNTSYQIFLSGRGRYLVSVSDDKGKELGVYAVPYDKSYSVDDSKKSQVWLPPSYASYAEHELSFKFRSIFDISGTAAEMTGGLSAEYTDAQTVMMPALEVITTVVLSVLGEETQYPVAFSSDAPISLSGNKLRTSSTRTGTITARQKQLVWEYDLNETAVAGYRIELDGEGMDASYRLDIDLTRKMSGAIPGIAEYLVDGGKRLYSVSYHVDGDILLELEHIGTATSSNAELATGSNAEIDFRKATDSNLATDSNGEKVPEPGVLTLDCTLKAELLSDDEDIPVIRFTLTLPDLSYDFMPDEIAELYLEAFPDGLYQTEMFRLDILMVNRYYRKEDTEIDLTDLRGELEDDIRNHKE